MNLTLELLRRLEESGLSEAELAQRRCALAYELEDAGNFDAARNALGDLWQGIGERPRLDGLDAETRAHVLLRVGSLTGWLGSAGGAEGTQERAKDLLGESKALFESLADWKGAIRAQLELAWCYWREGALDDARLTLRDATGRLASTEGDLLALALVRLAEVERTALRNDAALEALEEAEPYVAASADDALKGKFHSTRAGALESLAYEDGREGCADRALIELSAAHYHFGEAGHTRYRAAAVNNLGFSLLRLGRPAEAFEHLERARRIYETQRDEVRVAQVDETRARALLAQRRHAEAERVLRPAVRTLERCDEKAQLAEALETLGAAQARLGRAAESLRTFTRAADIECFLGESEAAGRILIRAVEELAASAPQRELRELYLRADVCLERCADAALIARLRDCARRLLAPARDTSAEGDALPFIHASEESALLLAEARRLAAGSGAILLSGETGTGKEVLAQLLHEWSGRGGRFVAVNCAALSDTLFESQLFGHRKGSFTDALADHRGLAREADGGTLYLDEIGEMSLANQAKLLRLIDGGEFYPVGSSTPERVDVRVIAATNCDLKRRVAQGLFRTDLFYRLAAFHLTVPPLRQRPRDIPALARHFIAEAAGRYDRSINFTDEAVEAMAQLHLNGNARELRGLIERTFITAPDGTTVGAASVVALAARAQAKGDFASAWDGCSFEEEVRSHEARLIRLALQTARGSVTRAARLLNITHQGLAYMLNGRHKDLLPSRKPARTRRVSIIPKASKSQSAGKR